MGLDGAGEDLELEVAIGVNHQDSHDSWVGVFVADYHMSTNDRIEARTGIGRPNPETASSVMSMKSTAMSYISGTAVPPSRT